MDHCHRRTPSVFPFRSACSFRKNWIPIVLLRTWSCCLGSISAICSCNINGCHYSFDLRFILFPGTIAVPACDFSYILLLLIPPLKPASYRSACCGSLGVRHVCLSMFAASLYDNGIPTKILYTSSVVSVDLHSSVWACHFVLLTMKMFREIFISNVPEINLAANWIIAEENCSRFPPICCFRYRNLNFSYLSNRSFSNVPHLHRVPLNTFSPPYSNAVFFCETRLAFFAHSQEQIWDTVQ